MTDLWNNVTVAQAVVAAVAVWLLLRTAEAIADMVRRHRGLPIQGDHCDHCEVVDALDEQVAKLVDYARDQHGELERIRDAVERNAETTDKLVDV